LPTAHRSFSNADANPESIADGFKITCVCNGFTAPEYFPGFGRMISLMPFAHARKT